MIREYRYEYILIVTFECIAVHRHFYFHVNAGKRKGGFLRLFKAVLYFLPKSPAGSDSPDAVWGPSKDKRPGLPTRAGIKILIFSICPRPPTMHTEDDFPVVPIQQRAREPSLASCALAAEHALHDI